MISAETKLAEIHLNESEYSNFEQFEGREIRKNRYFHEFDRVISRSMFILAISGD